MKNSKFFFPILIFWMVGSILWSFSCVSKMKKEEWKPSEKGLSVPQKAPEVEEAPVDVEETWTAPAKEEEAPLVTPIAELNKQQILKTVYFDFDKYDLREDTIAILKENARWLREHKEYKILLEGHCDERGTIEYNLELGAKRANAVKLYLIHLGLDGERFKMISYGEERPADPGHNEEAWAKNRRVEFVIEQ